MWTTRHAYNHVDWWSTDKSKQIVACNIRRAYRFYFSPIFEHRICAVEWCKSTWKVSWKTHRDNKKINIQLWNISFWNCNCKTYADFKIWFFSQPFSATRFPSAWLMHCQSAAWKFASPLKPIKVLCCPCWPAWDCWQNSPIFVRKVCLGALFSHLQLPNNRCQLLF